MEKNILCVEHVSRQGKRRVAKLKSCDIHLPDDLSPWEMDEGGFHSLSTTYHLMDCDSISPPTPTDDGNSFHDYTRILAGSGAPIVDASFTAIPVPDSDLTVHYKFASATK